MAREQFVPTTYPAYDGTVDIDRYRELMRADYRRQRAEWMRQSNMAAARGDRDRDRPLYRITAGGNWRRTKPVRGRALTATLDRDGHACVLCGGTERLEVDHIIRYIDGGSNDPDNLRTLCHSCHARRGGR